MVCLGLTWSLHPSKVVVVNDFWKTELWRFSALLVASSLIGLASGFIVLTLLLMLLAYICWHTYNLYRLVRWLNAGRANQPPVSSGIWEYIYKEISSLQHRNKKRKRDLGKMLKRFHKMTMALPDATVELRADSEELQWWNHAAEKYLGFQHPRDNSQRISNLLRHPDFIEYLENQDYEKEVEIPSPMNESINLRIRIIPYSGNRRLLVARDMTRIQLLERTRQDFVANVSHELRSPLTVIAGYLETMIDIDDFKDQYSSQIQVMLTQTQRMNRIVGDLLLLSRLESEVVSMDDESVFIPRLLDAIVAHARDLSGDNKHDFIIDIDRDLCMKGHEGELYSAFSNIVFNAVHYTPEGGCITIRWKNRGTTPVFSVKDTGIGIDSHHIPRLTERFYRADKGRSRAEGGTGLGLAIVKHVLLRHHAHLQVDSEPGRGSEFRCVFDECRKVLCNSVAQR